MYSIEIHVKDPDKREFLVTQLLNELVFLFNDFNYLKGIKIGCYIDKPIIFIMFDKSSSFDCFIIKGIRYIVRKFLDKFYTEIVNVVENIG